VTPAKLRAYVQLAFRTGFPRAQMIGVAFLDLQETWVVAVDGDIYTMFVGSDDDEFSFVCETNKRRARVRFPLPPGMRG
jgi:hypothetical protein